MRKLVVLLGALAIATPAFAGPLADSSLATLELPSVFYGDFEGGTADNTAGWSGIDDVVTLNHPGGLLVLDLDWDLVPDIDLRLYADDESTVLATSYAVPGPEHIEGDYGAGTYYVLIDIWSGAPAPYELSYTPEPSSLLLIGLAGLFLRRR